LPPHVVNKWKSDAASYTFKYNHECIERVRDQNHSTANNGFKHVPLNKLNSCKLPAYQGLKWYATLYPDFSRGFPTVSLLGYML